MAAKQRFIPLVLTGNGKPFMAEVDKTEAYVKRKLPEGFKKADADILRGVQKNNREQVRDHTQTARSAARQYEKELSGGFFSKLARGASSEWRKGFKVDGQAVGGVEGGLLGGIVTGLKVLPGLGMLAGGISSVTSAIKDGVKFGFDYNRMLQENGLRFEVMLGSAEKARALIADLSKLEKKGITLPEAMEGAKRLLAMNMEAKDIPATILAIGEASKMTGADVDSVTRALTQMMSKGTASSEEISQQIAEQGIPAWRYLADALAKADAQFEKLGSEERISRIKKLVEQGKISGKGAAQAILIGMQEEFSGGAERFLNETVTGLEQRIYARAQRLVGTGLQSSFGGYQGFLKQTADALDRQGFMSAAEGVSEFPNAVGRGFMRTVEDVRSGATQLGIFVKQGLDSGIVGTGVSHGKQYVSDFAAAIGAHSPATEFIPLGEMAAQGFKIGFTNEMRAGGGVMGLFNVGSMSKTQARSLGNLNKLAEREPDFLPKLIAGARARGIDPNHLLNVMAVETGGSFNPQARNPLSSASGMIQFMRDTAKDLGTTIEAIRKMNATQQLDYVFKYLDQKIARYGAMDTQGKVYASVGAGRYGPSDEAVLMRRGTEAYRLNAPTWDRDSNGIIRQGELAASALEKLGAGVNFTVGGGVVSAANPMPVRLIGLSGGATGEAFGTKDIEHRAGMFSELPSSIGKTEDTVASLNERLSETDLSLMNLATVSERALIPLPEGFQRAAEAAGGLNLKIEQTVPLFAKTAQAASKESEQVARALADIGGNFFENLLTQPREAFKQLRQDFLRMLLDMGRDWVQSTIYKALNPNSKDGAASSGSNPLGGLLGGIKKLFNFGGASETGSITPPQSFSSRATGAAQIAEIVNGQTPLHGIGGGEIGTPASASGAASGGFLSSLGASLPALGAAYGIQSWMGAVRGELSTLQAITGAGLVGYFVNRAIQRRKEEKKRDTLSTDVRSQAYDILWAAQAGKLTESEALAQWSTLKQRYFSEVAQLKDSKTRSHATLWWNQDLEPFLLPKIKEAAKRGEVAQRNEGLFVPTYGFASGGGAWMQRLVPFRGRVPGVYDRRDDKLARLTGNEVVLTPDVWQPIAPYLKAKRVPGFRDGGAGNDVRIPTAGFTGDSGIGERIAQAVKDALAGMDVIIEAEIPVKLNDETIGSAVSRVKGKIVAIMREDAQKNGDHYQDVEARVFKKLGAR
jgi:tape measure domain-containing protein